LRDDEDPSRKGMWVVVRMLRRREREERKGKGQRRKLPLKPGRRGESDADTE
jgi:phage protein U